MSPRALRSREKIIRAATDLLVERGPRAVTVDAVSEESGVAKSTLYRHWESRDDLLIDVVRQNVPDAGGADLDAGFVTALRTHVRTLALTFADPEWSRILPAMLSLRTAMPEIAAVVERDMDDKYAVLRSILQLGVDEGLLPAAMANPRSVEDVSSLLFGPLFVAAIADDHHRVEGLGSLVVERFLASFGIDAD